LPESFVPESLKKRCKMAKVEMTFEMKFPARCVFDYWANVNHWNEWAEEMGKVELITDGPTHVGTKVRGVNKVFGRSVEWNCTISEYRPDESFAFVFSDPMMTITERDNFESMGNATTVHSTMDLRTIGIARLLQPYVIWRLKKRSEKDISRLSKVLESRDNNANGRIVRENL
jgi:uncharacterized membrane protein